MKALVCHAPHDLRLQDWPSDALAPHQLRVKVAFGGICGSDLHYFHQGGFGTVRIQHPMVLGHEVSGVIAEVGEAVARADLKVGDRIAISPSRPCGHCEYCLQGMPNHCLDMRFYGSAMRNPHIHGAFAEEVVIDAHQAHVLAPSVSLSMAACAEPISVGLHAIRRAGSVFGKTVMVTGCGPIGNLLIGGLRRAGAARIVAVDVSDFPLSVARAMGADDTINLTTQADLLEPLKRDKGRIDVMFEASGHPSALQANLELVKPRGVVVCVGVGNDITLPISRVVAKELELRGTFRFHEEFATAVGFLNEGLIDPRPVISHTVPSLKAQDGFLLAGDKSQAMKVQIDFGVVPA